MTRLNRNRFVEILRLVGCENLISQRKEFIFNAFVYFQPVQRFQNRSDMRRFWRSGDSTSKRVLDVLEFFLSETVEDYSTVSCSSRV